MKNFYPKQLKKIYYFLFAVIAISALFFVLALAPPSFQEEKVFRVEEGDGFAEISARLREKNLIRSSYAFEIIGLATGKANKLKPGTYTFNGRQSTTEILKSLSEGPENEVSVSIIEGYTKFDIDSLLSQKGVLNEKELLGYLEKSPQNLEGMLFPDTYRFYLNSKPEEVIVKIISNFEEKALPILEEDPSKINENLILASIIEREAPYFNDRKFISGILKKRLNSGMPLQADATICYAKDSGRGFSSPCYPITSSDLKIESPYNTYLRRGLPLGPIGNPGIEAIRAAVYPSDSPYWYYLSDPVTRKTVFSVTLDEHLENRNIHFD